MRKSATKTKAAVEPQFASRERVGVQSIDRAFGLLEQIAQTPSGVSLAKLSKDTGLHSSTIFHIVKTLMWLGYIRQDPETKRYHVGSLVFSLAGSARPETALLRIAAPILDDVARLSGGTVHLAIFSSGEIMIIARRAGPGPFQLSEDRKGIRPGHATALGKALLAFSSPEVMDGYLASHPRASFTDNTIVNLQDLRRELAGIRERGVALDDGEFNVEVKCVALPVFDNRDTLIAAIGVSRPIWQETKQVTEATKDTLRQAVARFREAIAAIE